ncbi:hypothetical protein COU57_06585 [Candidatus Pacearchaeota archaeon CG10_big_fil_rev_8_21_14_0_10_32_14]|nr:MAG: hypothetical protein COU57_06585 [Candidatus Pacearchaeota archaeon CG10_big_fil_rev_8_21_14_0_10_32_14]
MGGESLFGSLTNEFGDRFKARNVNAIRSRTASRILVYQIKLLIRCETLDLRVFIRHALFSEIYKI